MKKGYSQFGKMQGQTFIKNPNQILIFNQYRIVEPRNKDHFAWHLSCCRQKENGEKAFKLATGGGLHFKKSACLILL
jgi:hypothetical protein